MSTTGPDAVSPSPSPLGVERVARFALRGVADGREPGASRRPPGRRRDVLDARGRGRLPRPWGALLVETLRAWGCDVPDATVVADGPAVAEAIAAAIALAPDLVLTTGGTGLTPTDGTPEATRPLLHREVPGLAEAIRARGVANGIPTAVLSRGLAGLAGRTLVVNLPGSSGGVRDALAVLAEVLPHALSQAQGGDH